MGLAVRPGPGSLRGLEWLARVGPAPLEAWRLAMGWSVPVAFSHARRLEEQRWLERYAMTRGHGSLLVCSRAGIGVLGVGVSAAKPPAPTWWAHLQGCAWAAAWLTARGREMLGPQELLADPRWRGEVRFSEGGRTRKVGHHPDLVWAQGDGRVAIEVELAQKSVERLKAIVGLHARWRAGGVTGGVIYICSDRVGCERVVAAAPRGLTLGRGGGLRVETLETIKQQTEQAASRPAAASA